MKPAERLFKKTAAYRAALRDKQSGKLCHSYLISCRDSAWQKDYLKALCKLIMCEKGDFCGECRSCRQIEKENFIDCEFYPKDGEKITAEGIEIIATEKCYVKPLEASCKVFAIGGAEKMNVPSQNKLLKTLEEPPENVYIVLSALGDFNLLPTVKSRVKKLEIPLFAADEIFGELKENYADEERLKKACLLSEGKPGEVERLYSSDSAAILLDECVTIFKKMKKSPDIAYYSGKLAKKTREEFGEFLIAMRLVVRDLILIKEGAEEGVINRDRIEDLRDISLRYREWALLSFSAVLDKTDADSDRNGNQIMLADGLLFALLEENYRWQKL
ncbi:MAG: hypothetical protein J6U35_03695 [Clostridia bacterium]|nr:hypothetical protein [Clostridia bacterium]